MSEPNNEDTEFSFSSLNEIHADVKRTLAATSDMTTLSAEFRALNSNSERVYFAYDILKKHGLLPAIIKGEKCDDKSEERRRYGNHMFTSKKDYSALKHYNKSVAYAKSKETLSIAYANRSAVLFTNKLYKECLKDIENALSNDYPENLQEKSTDRKQKALKHLEGRASRQAEAYFTEVPKVTGSENEIFECASDSIEMKCTEKLGRHIVATREIETGDVIAVEKPYSTILLYNFYLTHCHHCLKISYNLIPCLQCPLALFCSEICRNAAWERYHRFECPLLDTLQSIDVTKLQLLALRVVVCARDEFNKLGEYESKEEETSIYKSESYREIHNLVTNEEFRPVNDLFARSTVAAVLLYLLEQTPFFDSDNNSNSDSESTEAMKKCTAGLLLRHLQTAPSNMHEISELQGNSEKGYENIEIGAGAYAFMSLLNHSCAPNVVRHDHGTTMVLRALRPIQVGEQLFDNYGYHHALMEREERQKHLSEQYYFTCECIACINDWPLYLKLSEEEEGSDSLISDEEMSSLTAAKRDIAEKLLPRLVENAKSLETWDESKHKQELDKQEILKQCFAILGNKHTII